MKGLFILSFLLGSFLTVNAQECEHLIHFDVLDDLNYFTYFNTGDTIVNLEDSRVVDIKTIDCYGSGTFTISYSSQVIISGSYLGESRVQVDLLEEYDPETETFVEGSRSYYLPLRDGEWKYYNEKGELIKSEQYVNGLIKKD